MESLYGRSTTEKNEPRRKYYYRHVTSDILSRIAGYITEWFVVRLTRNSGKHPNTDTLDEDDSFQFGRLKFKLQGLCNPCQP